MLESFGANVIICPTIEIREPDNYDRLGYPPDGAARDARYTRYVCETALLRTQTSAMLPPLLRALAAAPPEDVVLSCPGLVYRRDVIDRRSREHRGQGRRRSRSPRR